MEHAVPLIVVVLASAGEVVHSSTILMQQSMYLDGIMAKGSTFKRSQREHSWSKEKQFVLDKDHNIWEFTEAIRVLRSPQFIVAIDHNI